jgi:PAS domain S-box-containing protein
MDERKQTVREESTDLALQAQQIKDDQARYHRLLNAIHEVYYRADIAGNITEISPSIGAVAGYDRDEITGRPASFLYKRPEDSARFLSLLQRHESVSDFEFELLHKDGHAIHVSANAHLIFDDARNCTGVEGLLRDISERVGLETQLRILNEELESRVAKRTADLEAKIRQLQTLSQAVEQSAEGFIITDCSGKVQYVNPAFEKINGYSADEVIGRTLSMLDSGKHDADFFHQIWSALRSGRVWEGTMINRRKDGSEYPALMTIAPIRHHDVIEHYAAIQQDMSEYEKLEAQFRQAQKMEEIGTLVGGIAHDFNNMLAGLLMHLYMAKKKIANTDLVLDKLNKAEKLGYRASEMIKGLLIFSRNDESEKKPLVLNTMLRDSISMLRVSIPEHITLSLDICEEKFSVHGDVTQLQQVLMNMFNNARDALGNTPDAGIRVSLERFVIDQSFADRHPDIHEEALAKLSISDNGCGIPEAVISRIFDPFFTSKAAGHGTGLGLSMAYGCVQGHDGLLEVESTEGTGTTFHIYLPLIEEQPSLISATGLQSTYTGRGELVLIADDNQIIRQVIVEALRSLDYKAIAAADGAEAMRLFEQHQDEIRLAILDMVMPRMSGREVARRMRLSMPDLPVIFATAHDEEEKIREVKTFENSALYEKPFKMKTLSRTISELLA